MSFRVRTRVLLGVAVPMLVAVAVVIAIALTAVEARGHLEAGADDALDATMARLVQIAAFGGVLVAIACLASAGIIAWHIGRDIGANAAQLRTSSAEVGTLLAQQDLQSAEQARVASEAAATMSRVEGSAKQFGEEAVRAAEFAREALAMSEAGVKALEGMVAGIEALRAKAAEVSRETERLNQHTSEIGSITLIVGDLATRTTMLALNAAAEAARAGENGKGFTNVAADVRKLADESQRSAERISLLVAQIRGSTDQTVALAEQEQQTLREAMALSEQTERQFAGIAAMLEESYKGAESISKTAERQHDAIRRVLTSIDTVRTAAKLTSTGIQEARKNVGHVETATMRLQQMV